MTEKLSEDRFSRRWEGSTRSNHGGSLSWGTVCGVGSVIVSGGRGWANVEGHPVKAGNPSLPPPLPGTRHQGAGTDLHHLGLRAAHCRPQTPQQLPAA